MIKSSFSEDQAPYDSGPQNARHWTENWVGGWAFCPSCGNDRLEKFEHNRPAADFFCSSCSEQYELKSKKGPFGRRVVDGAASSMRERLKSESNPNLFLLQYSRRDYDIANLVVVPKRFFVEDIIQERKPLAPSAKRAGWIGCNLLLDRIPASGKIFLVKDAKPLPRNEVRAEWGRNLFRETIRQDARGWLLDVVNCIESIGRREFDINDVYAFEQQLCILYPGNRHVKEKVRQQLQFLRDRDYMEFVSRGYYRLRAPV